MDTTPIGPPILESVLGPKRNAFVMVYPRRDGFFNVWVYAWDTKTSRTLRCMALRTWCVVNNRWSLCYEIGDLDIPTTKALDALCKSSIPLKV